ncbi:MAG: hypothetical protein K6A80_00650 [Saccharofermentans sp.]|nr:hypothetical protein [Saccharofermentans sp.]
MICQKAIHCTIKNRKGSITLETAISFAVTLIFLCAIVSVISFYRSDILMQRSTEQVLEEVSMIPPVSIPVSDAVSTLVNALPESDAVTGNAAERAADIIKTVTGIDSLSGYSLEKLFLEGTLSHIIADNIRQGYIDRNGGSEFMVPDSIDVDINPDLERHILEVEVTYDTNTLAGNIRRTIYSSVPVYGESSLFLNASSHGGTGTDIWSKDNFTRGDYFRERNGANLPKTFPVIDAYENGTATSIVSIDLTAPTYSSSASLIKKMYEEIDKLADFDGANVIISGRRYEVDGGDISSRRLIAVIPGNSPESAEGALRGLSAYAALRGVDLNIVEYGNSQRYAE